MTMHVVSMRGVDPDAVPPPVGEALPEDVTGTAEGAATADGSTVVAAGAATRARRGLRLPHWLGAVLGPLVVILFVLGAWQAASSAGLVKAYVLPPPGEVLSALGDNWSVYVRHAKVTTMEAVLGFVFGNLVAVLLAVLFVHSRVAERSVYPLTLASRSIPVVALGPVVVLWLGTGLAPKVVIASFLVFFPTLVNMMRGLRAVRPAVDELLYTLSANWWQRLVKVRLPASLPYLFAALKIAAGTCFLGAVVAEWIGANRGLGYLVVVYGSQYESPGLWGAVVVMSTLSVCAFLLVSFVEWLVMPWARGSSNSRVV